MRVVVAIGLVFLAASAASPGEVPPDGGEESEVFDVVRVEPRFE